MPSNARAQNQAKLNQEAIAHFYAGRLKEAEAICTKILRTTPQQSDTLNVLSAIHASQGKFEEAITVLNRAILYNPNGLDSYVNRSNYLQQLGRLKEALESSEQGLTVNPDFLPALLSKSAAQMALRQYLPALKTLQHTQRLQPELPMLAFRMGDVHYHLELYSQSLGYYDKAQTLLPPSPELLQNRAMTLRALERYDEAIDACNAGLAIAPSAGLYHLRGTILQNKGKLEDALLDYAHALECDPNHAPSHQETGRAWQRLGRAEDAIESLAFAANLQPNDSEVLNSYANGLLALDRPAEALTVYDHIRTLISDNYQLRCNHSNALFKLGRYQESLVGYDAAIQLMPRVAAAYCGKGTVFTAMGQYLQALVQFNQALAHEPESPLAQFNMALHRLLHGNFPEGWRLYEARWKKPDQHDQRSFAQPLWLGDAPLADKTILLHAEQGLGDSIQFIRYVPLIEAMGAKVILEMQAPLVRLMTMLPGKRSVLARGDDFPAFDFHCPLMSLPLAFDTRLETIPNTMPYLSVPETVQADWYARLGPKSKPRIGLAWSGARKHAFDYHRSLSLETLAPLLASHAEFHSLQKEVREVDDIFLRNSPIVDHRDSLGDMADTAGLVSAMDLVISVDTSIAHLAGALGKPVLLLLPYSPDFRWLLGREDSPWYPNTKLIRQTESGHWGSVVSQLLTRFPDTLIFS